MPREERGGLAIGQPDGGVDAASREDVGDLARVRVLHDEVGGLGEVARRRRGVIPAGAARGCLWRSRPAITVGDAFKR